MRKQTYRTISQLPETEKPYEKCEHFGPQALSDAELLAVLLRTGAEGVNVLDMSREVLAALGRKGVAALSSISAEELRRIRGIGRVKALQIRCLAELSRRIAQAEIGRETELDFRDPEVIADYYMEELRHEAQEILYLLCLSSKGKLLGREIIARGSVNCAVIESREVFVSAMRHGAVSVILLHNHPSGDPTPSDADCRLTRRIWKGGELVGIRLLDHIVIGDRRFASLRMSGRMAYAEPLRAAS